MIFVIVATIENKITVITKNSDQGLKDFITKFEGIGKQKSIKIYEGNEIDYTFVLEDKQKTVTVKVPKIDIVR